MKKICFLVGSANLSGGTYVIVQHASYLQLVGCDVTLGIQDEFTESTLNWHDNFNKLSCLSMNDAANKIYDIVIATWWKTAFEITRFKADIYVYFVQSIESNFYSKSELPLKKLINSTYSFPIHFVTEAVWIKDYLYDNHGQEAKLVRNGVRKDLYSTYGKKFSSNKHQHQPRILIEGHFNVPFKNTGLAIRLAKRAGARDIWVLTGSEIKFLPGVSKVFSRIPIQDAPAVYRSCDILLKLSTVEGMFGPPLEMFHCGGTAIVYDVSGHDEYIINNKNAYVCYSRDSKSVEYLIKRLLTDRIELNRLKKNALLTAKSWPSWDKSSNEFKDALFKLKKNNQYLNSINDIHKQSFDLYVYEEQERLRKNPLITIRYKLLSVVKKLPFNIFAKCLKLKILFSVI